jgi:putative ABC transport system permease protein
MALGGQPAHEVRRMAWQAAGAVVVGIIGGVLLATSFTHALASMLFQVKPFDVFSFAEGALVLAAAAAIASYLPARRVTRVDPLIALRHE